MSQQEKRAELVEEGKRADTNGRSGRLRKERNPGLIFEVSCFYWQL